MKRNLVTALLVTSCLAGSAFAQGGNPDYRVRATFRAPADGAWASNQSIGHAEFRVHSRFGHLYYGGVIRLDDYKFSVQIDFRSVSGFDTQFASSPYDTDYDLYINNGYVGRALMGSQSPGLAELVYDSRHATPPALPLPENFPEPVGAGDGVSVYFAAPTEPLIGDPAPADSPIFASTLEERYLRGDVNFDGKVDEDDYPYLANNYDPHHRLGDHIGPVAGDFTGDNLADRADYDLFIANWTDSHDAPSEPDPVIGPCDPDLNADGALNFFDVQAFLGLFSNSAPQADLNADGALDFFDVQAFLNQFSQGC
ncbi:MAG: hypothetical protein KJZ65_03225 [Phycisphaerales bacterium]|nr:hypothetical protein [Phycisphaerales bacterium]